MPNEYGLDYKYFIKKLSLVIRDADRYTPDEMARELARLSVTADGSIILEKEFVNADLARANVMCNGLRKSLSISDAKLSKSRSDRESDKSLFHKSESLMVHTIQRIQCDLNKAVYERDLLRNQLDESKRSVDVLSAWKSKAIKKAKRAAGK
jgi:hypothetical protein